MKKSTILFILIFCLASVLLPTIITLPANATSTVGESINFRLDCTGGSLVQWIWGDGEKLYGVNGDLQWHDHFYKNPGTYNVHMNRYYWFVTPSCPNDEFRTVTILEDRSISASPTTPIIGQPVTFTAINFNTPTNITWDLGNGTIHTKQGEVITYAYSTPGSYTIKAYDWNGSTKTTPVTMVLVVSSVDTRQITVSNTHPYEGQTVTFTAMDFLTPANITWDLGDGTTLPHKGSVITHAYTRAGIYMIKAFDSNGNPKIAPITITLTVFELPRSISFSPASPRVDQQVTIKAINFESSQINWDFGDGILQANAPTTVDHRYANPGSFNITAREQGLNAASITRVITLLPENRSLSLSDPEVMKDEILTVTAVNFRGQLVLWDFGDGTIVSGPATMTHAYKYPGNYIITARDENGASGKTFQISVQILGITDVVNLEIAELTLDNGKYYKVIPKNSKNIRAQLRMKMRGTGIVSGYWIVDGQPYQFFNETVYQGQINMIVTKEIPGLPTFDPGMHNITMKLTRPAREAVVFPTLRYFVLPYENEIGTLMPKDGAVIKEDRIARFLWEEALGGSYYQIAFSNSLFPLLRNDANMKWLDCPDRFSFIPDAETWNVIQRNHWSYWKVRALDSNKNILGESSVQEMKIIIPGAQIGIEKITDMDGNGIAIGSEYTSTKIDTVMIYGHLTYPGEAEYLILRVYANNAMVDQLLFRNVKKDEKRTFETSVPNTENDGRVIFHVLKSSSPSVIIGYLELNLKKQ